MEYNDYAIDPSAQLAIQALVLSKYRAEYFEGGMTSSPAFYVPTEITKLLTPVESFKSHSLESPSHLRFAPSKL